MGTCSRWVRESGKHKVMHRGPSVSDQTLGIMPLAQHTEINGRSLLVGWDAGSHPRCCQTPEQSEPAAFCAAQTVPYLSITQPGLCCDYKTTVCNSGRGTDYVAKLLVYQTMNPFSPASSFLVTISLVSSFI